MLTAEHLLAKYPIIAPLQETGAIDVFLADSIALHDQRAFKNEIDYQLAVEYHTMMCIVSSYPEIAQQYNKSQKRIRSEEGNSKEEYEERYANNNRISEFENLYKSHIRRAIITTRVYPKR